MLFFPVAIFFLFYRTCFIGRFYVYIPLIFMCYCQKLASASKYILVRCSVRRIERFAAYFRKRAARVSHNVHTELSRISLRLSSFLSFSTISVFSLRFPSGKFREGLACVRLVVFVRPLSGSVSKQASRLIKICDFYVYVKKELLREGSTNHDDAV